MSFAVQQVLVKRNDDGTIAWEYPIPTGSWVKYHGLCGWAGRVFGPTHEPFWIDGEGQKHKKGPQG